MQKNKTLDKWSSGQTCREEKNGKEKQRKRCLHNTRERRPMQNKTRRDEKAECAKVSFVEGQMKSMERFDKVKKRKN